MSQSSSCMEFQDTSAKEYTSKHWECIFLPDSVFTGPMLGASCQSQKSMWPIQELNLRPSAWNYLLLDVTKNFYK